MRARSKAGFGSISDGHESISSRAAVGCKAALEQEFLDDLNLTGSLHPKLSFNLLGKLDGEGQDAARSEHSRHSWTARIGRPRSKLHRNFFDGGLHRVAEVDDVVTNQYM